MKIILLVMEAMMRKGNFFLIIIEIKNKAVFMIMIIIIIIILIEIIETLIVWKIKTTMSMNTVQTTSITVMIIFTDIASRKMTEE